MELGAVLLVLLVLALAWLAWRHLRRVIVYDFQQALLYRNGRFQRLLEPGAYHILVPWQRIDVADTRRTLATIPGQEILTRDQIALRLSLSCAYRIADPLKALRGSSHYVAEFYAACQLVLREHLAGLTLDDYLAARADTDARLAERIAAAAEPLGLAVETVAVRDIMLPGGLKRAYAGVLEARKEAERRLEEARGEQAVLRSLANAARLYAESPALMQARMIQALGQGGNTLVFGADPAAAATAPPKSRARKPG